jgi:anaerobic ribonucleoside-triphosphate reductase activating protein
MGDQTDQILNIAATYTGTHVLGPGFRSVVWVQGCPFHCYGCISPQWIPIRPARQVSVSALIDDLLSNPQVDGLTFSGGEPFLQASGLASLIRKARHVRDLTLICYTGYSLSDLRQLSSSSDAAELLDQVDVLIDGPYIQDLDDNRGVRGSSNQTVHFLTDRIKGYDFHTQLRKSEVIIRDGEVFFVGVPPKNLLNRINHDLASMTKLLRGLYAYPHVESTHRFKEV